MAVPIRSSLPYKDHQVVTSDDAVLAAHSIGDGPPVLLANGIGCNRPALDMLVDHLRHRYRVISWDYRGTGGSSATVDGLESMAMTRHARDGLEVLDHLGIDAAAVFGWSMGVPVGLEMIRRSPRRVRGFGALFGSAGPPFRAAFARPLSDVFEAQFRAARHAPWLHQGLLVLGARVPPLAWWTCRGIRFVGRRTHRTYFQGLVRSASAADKRAYFNTLRQLLLHDARDVLPHVSCPTLVVAGRHDLVTPPVAAREMHAQVPHARLAVLEDASHFGVMEPGGPLWQLVDELLEQTFAAPAELARVVVGA